MSEAAISRDEPGTSPLRFRVFGLTWLSYAAYYLVRKNFSVAKATLQDTFHITTNQLGLIDAGYSAAYAAGQFVWGAAADRFGPRRVIAIGMIATALCSIGFGSSSSFAFFFLFWTLNGFAQATGWSPNVKAMTGWFSDKTRGAVMGVWTTNYSAGGFIANPIAHAFLVSAYGWRSTFWGPAILVMIVGGGVGLFLPERSDARETSSKEGDQSALVAAREARSKALRTPLLWALGASYFFMKAARYFFWYWAPFYMEKVLGYDKALAANVPLVFDAAGIAGAITVGWVSDRWAKGRRVPVAIASLVALAASLALYSRVAALGLWPNIIALALCGFFLFGPDALVSATAAQDVGGPKAAAIAAGVINGFGSVGQIASGLIAPEKSVSAKWSLVYGELAAGALIAALVLAPFFRARAPAENAEKDPVT